MSAEADVFWSALPLGRGVTILARDANGIAALDKPAGILSHPNDAGDESRSLLQASYDAENECYVWAESGVAPDAKIGVSRLAATGPRHRLWLLNRLDSATSGAILVAADAALAQAIRAQFKARRVSKIYQALVFGRPRQPTDKWIDVMDVARKAGQIRTSAGFGKMTAESRMKVLRTRLGVQPLALIQLEPRTGRSHQLRVQCARRKLPIVGDQTYGDFSANRHFAKKVGTKRMFLHSLETRFEYDWQGAHQVFAAHAPLPDEFDQALRG